MTHTYSNCYLKSLPSSGLAEKEDSMRKAFQEFIDSEFLNTNPFSQSDDEMFAGIEARSRIPYHGYFLKDVERLCSRYRLVSLTDHTTELEDDIYGGVRVVSYQVLTYTNASGRTLHTSLRTFRANLNPYLEVSGKSLENHTVTSSFNNMTGDEAINLVSHNIGKDVMLAYSFPCKDEYFSKKLCYRFSEFGFPDHIRKQILLSQAFAINSALLHPIEVAPPVHAGFYGVDGYEMAQVIGREFSGNLSSLLDAKLREIEIHQAGTPDLF